MKTILINSQVMQTSAQCPNVKNFAPKSFFLLTHKRALLFLLLVVFALGQSNAQVALSGKITNTHGDPLIGATVLIKGTNIGTVTDIDGAFSINAPDSLVTLVVTYTGFATQEMSFKSLSERKNSAITMDKINLQNIDISLNEEAEQLDEVVVTGLSVKKERKSIGYTATSKTKKSKKIKKDKALKIVDSAPPSMSITKNSTVYTQADSPEKIIIRKPKSAPSPPKKIASVPYPTPETSYENYDFIQENEFENARKNPLSTFSIDVDAASYSNMRRFIQNGQKPPKDAIRIEEMINYFNYEYDNPTNEHPFAINTEISNCPWNENHRLVHIGLQGRKIAGEDLAASNIVFLIDVSGSMNASNKLPLLQSSFKMLVDQFRPQDKVAIVVYAGAAGVVLPPTAGNQKKTLKEAIDRLKAGGSTAGGTGIQLAYKTARENFIADGNNRVILATDGDFNVGMSNDSELVRMIEDQRKTGVFLTVLGFGMGNYQDSKMQKLADHGNGNHAYIDNLKEAKKVLVEEFGGTMFAIAKDVKLQIEFNPTKVESYRLIGYENRLLEDEDFNDDKKDAGELGSGHTVTALYEIIPKGVKSELTKDIDELKYQTSSVTSSSALTKELMNIKLRYKAPDGNISQLIEAPLIDTHIPMDKTSDNFRWSASVATFGMLLRNSKFKNNVTYTDCLKLAEGAKGYDLNGYRGEMITLIQKMKTLVDPDLAGK
ncbi:von Willebrand factor type A domain-containing protein [Saprospiraceae bacterium]|nr:von Willebrand factor type A domain-containing protein [Bacteroidota bacterium]MDB4727216.1 von Willebrand factor type A domain-containing protein [Saprospiraceae bacterium]